MLTAIDITSLLTTAELARLLRRNPATIVHWAKSGRIPVALWAGSDVRGARYRIDDVLAALRKPPADVTVPPTTVEVDTAADTEVTP